MRSLKPYYEDGPCTIYHGDAREVLPALDLSGVSVVITDPPYGETSLAWDNLPAREWLPLVEPVGNLWCFGSLKFFMDNATEFAGWTKAQDIVWEKHNGGGFAADRFSRVHELAAQFYRGRWADIYKEPVKTYDAVKRTVRKNHRPEHTGALGAASYQSEDGGPRLMRSVIQVRSCHHDAQHPTQKPLGIITPLVTYSCPPDGTVLDLFAGSGSTLRAAMDLGRRGIAIEIDERYCEIIAKRLGQGVLDFGGAA